MVNKRDYRIYSFLCWNSDQEYIYPYDFICEKINTHYKEVIKNYFKIYKVLGKNLEDTKIPNFIYPEFIHIKINEDFIARIRKKDVFKSHPSYFI